MQGAPAGGGWLCPLPPHCRADRGEAKGMQGWAGSGGQAADRTSGSPQKSQLLAGPTISPTLGAWEGQASSPPSGCRSLHLLIRLCVRLAGHTLHPRSFFLWAALRPTLSPGAAGRGRLGRMRTWPHFCLWPVPGRELRAWSWQG